VAQKLSNPSWKVIVSASLANTSSRALTSPAFFREACDRLQLARGRLTGSASAIIIGK
jgi:hypothetical protein